MFFAEQKEIAYHKKYIVARRNFWKHIYAHSVNVNNNLVLQL